MEILCTSGQAAPESNGWQAKANDSLPAAYVGDGQNHHNDPRALQASHEQIMHQAQLFGSLHNIDRPGIDMRVSNNLNSRRCNAIYSQMRQDPAAAGQMHYKYGRYMNADSG